MTQTISFRDFAKIKKMAQIVAPLVDKKKRVLQKIEALNKEIEELNIEIAGMETGIKSKYNYSTEDLVVRTVTPQVREDGTPILDEKTGKQKTKTTWEPADIVKYDEEARHYVIKAPELKELPEEISVEIPDDSTTAVPFKSEDSDNPLDI